MKKKTLKEFIKVLNLVRFEDRIIRVITKRNHGLFLTKSIEDFLVLELMEESHQKFLKGSTGKFQKVPSKKKSEGNLRIILGKPRKIFLRNPLNFFLYFFIDSLKTFRNKSRDDFFKEFSVEFLKNSMEELNEIHGNFLGGFLEKLLENFLMIIQEEILKQSSADILN